MVAFINAIPQAGTDNRGSDEKTPSTYKGQRPDFGQETAENLWRKAVLPNTANFEASRRTADEFPPEVFRARVWGGPIWRVAKAGRAIRLKGRVPLTSVSLLVTL
jgi:hypothetical protein